MKSARDNVAWLLRYYRPHRWALGRIVVQSVLQAAVGATIPFVYARIIDGVKAGFTERFLLISVGSLLALGAADFLLSADIAQRRAKLNILLEWAFRQQAFARVIRLDQPFFAKFATGDLITRLTDDVGTKLRWFSCSGVFRAVSAALRIIFALGAMLLLNPLLAALAIIPLPIQFFVFVRSSNAMRQRFLRLQTIISHVTSRVEQAFSGIRLIQAYGAENRQRSTFLAAASERSAAEVSAVRLRTVVHSLYGFFWQLAQVIVLVAGGWLVINEKITVGEFVGFNYYVTTLVFPMFDLGNLLVSYRQAAVCIERLRELEAYEPALIQLAVPERAEVPATQRTVLVPESPAPRCEIAFDSVCVGDNGHSLLSGVSFSVSEQRMIAIAGPVGSGKSTLVRLIPRFIEPSAGRVLMDGQDIRTFPLDRLRQLVGYVPQEALLFTDTIRNNIMLGRGGLTDMDLQWAAGLAQLTRDIAGFAQGFDTKVGPRGITLSGGQKQRIALARALIARPRVLILDDVTASLDADTEAALWEALYRVLPDITCIVVSHRTATLERADLVLVLDHGRLTEQGQHADLIGRDTIYRSIYARQEQRERLAQR